MVVPAEQAAANAFFSGVTGLLVAELKDNYQLWKREKDECEFLEKELLMLASAMDDEFCNSRRSGARRPTAAARAFSEEMCDLTHDIEDCIERFLHHVTCKEGASWSERVAHVVTTSRSRHKFAAKIKKLRKRSEEARKRIFTPPSAAAAAAAAPPAAEPAQPDNPVGIAEAKEKLRKLLLPAEPSPSLEPAPAQLTVVAVVGFGGSGKTTLARAVYESLTEAFPSRAWVALNLMENSDANGMLRDMHKQLRRGEEYSETSLTNYLKDKDRYLVVIDDVKMVHMENWDIVRNIFKGNGRVIVTTTIQSIANRCSSSENSSTDGTLGYVYKMRTLGDEDSRVIALQGRCSPEIVQGSAPLLKKCDGLPLALASVAKQLNSENEPTGKFCAELCRDLGYYLECEDEEEPNFARLRDVLMDNYTTLPDYTVRTCLLYLSLFPTDCLLKRNVIIRRWMAEGYTRSDPVAGHMRVADVNFKTLVDRSIIHPAEPSQNATVKTCKTTGIMHAFMLHKSMSKKFIMPFGAEQKKVRHLFIHGNNDTDSRSTLNTDLSCVRSLTVWGNAGDAISDFCKYKLIRVLDLEECTDLHDGHLKGICKLWNLRYLSLGPSISSIPMEIGRLQLLETLYVSKTKVNVLPIEVVELPCLIHLIGKFELQVAVPAKRKKLPIQLNIETLRGFVANGHQGFLPLIVHMKRLKKMKIWCEPVDHDPALLIVQMNNDLVDAIRKYIEDPIEVGRSRALSIDFQALPEGSLYALGELCNQSLRSGKIYHLSSLKLHGNSSTLPKFISLFPHLTELRLSTNVTQEYLSVLSELPCLLYLKLVTDCTESFIIQAETFTSLRRMCFVFLETNPTLLTINNGALPQLISLHLICEHLVGLSGIQTRYLRQLKEIVLHPAVGEQTRKAWEAEAASHPNRPDVFPNRKVQTQESQNNGSVSKR